MKALKEIQDICKGNNFCDECPIGNVQGECSFNILPCHWKLNQEPKFDYQEVVNHYGVKPQISITQEECAELIQSLGKALRTSPEEARDTVLEEIADVYLTLEYIKLIFKFSQDEIDDHIRFKQERLLKEMNGSEDM